MFRVTTPKTLGRDCFVFFNKCSLFSKRHLSRYEHILMFWNKFVYVITCTHDHSFIWCLSSGIIELCSGRLGSDNHPEIKKLLNGTRQVCLFSISFYPYCYILSFEDYEPVYCIVLYCIVLYCIVHTSFAG